MPPGKTTKQKENTNATASTHTTTPAPMPVFGGPLAMMMQSNYSNQEIARIVSQYSAPIGPATYGPMGMMYNQMKNNNYASPYAYAPKNQQKPAPVTPSAPSPSLMDRIMDMLPTYNKNMTPTEKIWDETRKEVVSAAFNPGAADLYELIRRARSPEDLHAYFEEKRDNLDTTMPH